MTGKAPKPGKRTGKGKKAKTKAASKPAAPASTPDPGALPRVKRKAKGVSPAVAAAVARAEARSAGKPLPEEVTPPVKVDPVIVAAEEIKAKLKAEEEKKRKPPVPYSAEIVARLCDHIAGGESLRSFCELDDTPAYSTVIRWLAEDDKKDLRVQYARAREAQADSHADQMIDVARTETDVNRARLIIDTMKWTAAKLRPKKYGEKVAAEHSGPDGGPIPVAADARSDIDNARRVAFALGRVLERQRAAAAAAESGAGDGEGASP